MLTKEQKETILSYAAFDMNLTKTANALHFHRNTIEYHLQQVEKHTGINPKKFYGLIELIKMILEENECVTLQQSSQESSSS